MTLAILFFCIIPVFAQQNKNSDSAWTEVQLGGGASYFLMELWLAYEDGGLICVNYQSKFEIKRRAELIESEKKDLYPTIRHFKEPILLLETDKYRIRIDDLGNWDYRYVSWPIKNSMCEKTEIVLGK